MTVPSDSRRGSNTATGQWVSSQEQRPAVDARPRPLP